MITKCSECGFGYVMSTSAQACPRCQHQEPPVNIVESNGEAVPQDNDAQSDPGNVPRRRRISAESEDSDIISQLQNTVSVSNAKLDQSLKELATIRTEVTNLRRAADTTENQISALLILIFGSIGVSVISSIAIAISSPAIFVVAGITGIGVVVGALIKAFS